MQHYQNPPVVYTFKYQELLQSTAQIMKVIWR